MAFSVTLDAFKTILNTSTTGIVCEIGPWRLKQSHCRKKHRYLKAIFSFKMQLTTSKATNKVSFASSRGQRVNVAKGTGAVTCRAIVHSRSLSATGSMLLLFLLVK